MIYLLFRSLLIIISNILSSVLCSDHFIKHFMSFYQYCIVLLLIVFTYFMHCVIQPIGCNTIKPIHSFIHSFIHSMTVTLMCQDGTVSAQ